MCNLYMAPTGARISMKFQVGAPVQPYLPLVAPLKSGPFVTTAPVAQVGQWGLIPPHSPTRKPMTEDGRPMSTNNARRERLATAWTFRGPWKRGQRCLVPAESFDEPYWGTGKNIWWRFSRADGDPWALAGIWSEWTDPATGECDFSYSLITQNCDAHPLLRAMHRPGPTTAGDKADKRAVVPLEREHWDQWLNGTVAQADQLIQLPSMDVFHHGAADPTKQVEITL
ncbi:SOS response-associated peptidase [Polaromonas sp. AER18D-145]|uniref:SOS response-associated peptidase n=1 Tax=Polaromonas sp. AER18D-145 TaxID=1977060 RepID=UPI00352A0E61